MSDAAKPSAVALMLSAAAIGGYFVLMALGCVSSEDAAEPFSYTEDLPEIVIDDLDGRPTAVRSFADKPLIINFWATWCAPCLREIPMLIEFREAHEDIEIVGIAVDRADDVRRFAEDMQFNYPVLVGPSAMDAAVALGDTVGALPLTIFTAAGGAVIGGHSGEIKPGHLESLREVLDALAAGAIDVSDARSMLAAGM